MQGPKKMYTEELARLYVELKQTISKFYVKNKKTKIKNILIVSNKNTGNDQNTR